jgi:hypothetical protein
MREYYWKDNKIHNKTQRVSDIRNALNIGPVKPVVRNRQLLEMAGRNVAGAGVPKSSMMKSMKQDSYAAGDEIVVSTSREKFTASSPNTLNVNALNKTSFANGSSNS